ncbi:hypothetical protein EFZ10_07565 [Tatumella sp. TA1]|nr:hypothetical protein EFZ10_07565 [Tatumella sp. TA1]
MKSWLRTRLTHPILNALVAVGITLCLNFPFFHNAYRLVHPTTAHTWLFMLSMPWVSFFVLFSLLILARVGQSFAAGSYQYFDIATAVIAPMVSELERQLTQRHQSLIIDLPDTALCLRGDITLLQMVVQNLIQNAHRYSPESSTIRLRLYQVTHGIALDIDDEGPGIDLQKATELSKAFVRMDRRYEGIGLGLNIVQRICQLHRAQFSLTNRDPHGCRATVIFSQQSA